MAAKQEVEREAAAHMRSYIETGLVDPSVDQGMRADPKAYGIKASRPVIETISAYVHEQGLTDRRVAVEELFAASTLDV